MTRDQIQAELDSLKGTKFDKLTDVMLLSLEQYVCENCKRKIALGQKEKHDLTCETVIEEKKVIKSILESNNTISFTEIGEMLNKKTNYVRTLFRRHKDLQQYKTSVIEESQRKENLILEIYNSGNYNNTEISEKTGFAISYITTTLQKNGLDPKKGTIRRKKPDNVQVWVELFQQGKSFDEIQKLTGDASLTVRKRLTRLGLYIPKKINSIPKVNENYELFLKLWDENPNQPQIYYAKKMNRTETMISNYIKKMKSEQ